MIHNREDRGTAAHLHGYRDPARRDRYQDHTPDRLDRCRWSTLTTSGHEVRLPYKAEAEEIKQRLAAFLRDDLKLEMSEEKTLITRSIPLKRQSNAVLTDRNPARAPIGKELITRLLTRRCEICQRTDKVQVYQVRKLTDLGKPEQPKPAWATLMAKRRRKTLVVCGTCHDTIHATRQTATPTQ